MTIEIMSGLCALLVLLTGAFFYSLTVSDRIDLTRYYGTEKRLYRTSGSEFGRIYDKYLEKPFGEMFRKAGALLGMNFQELEEQIQIAGMENKTSAIEIAALKVLGLLFLPAGVISVYVSKDMLYGIIVFVIFAALYLLPEAKLRDRTRERKDRILSELPSFIEQVYLCAETGANLKPALETVSYRFGGELGKIFTEAFRMDGLSKPWDRELLGNCRKLRVEALEDFVTDILGANTTGISINETLKNEVKHINSIHKAHIREKTQKLESGMTIPIMAFFVLPMMAIIMLPIVLEMMDAFS